MHGSHLVSHIHNHGVIHENVLHVIGVCSNPVRYQSRMRLAREWIEQMAGTPNVKLHIVETAFGDRHHELEKQCEIMGVDLLKLRTHSNFWIKESMINVMYRSIVGRHPHARYFAWVDMDVKFMNPHWAQEAIHQLQHYQVIQPWSDCIDLGPSGNIMKHFKSFGMQHQKRCRKQRHAHEPYEFAHSGFAWAATRRFMEQMIGAGGSAGPLMDYAPLGSADHHMAWAMIGDKHNPIHPKMHAAFFRRCEEWAKRAMMITHGEVGFQFGRIEHSFHGPKARRYYRERWEILVENCYNPDTMTMHDEQGLCYIVGNPKLEHAIHRYNLSRFEDSIEET